MKKLSRDKISVYIQDIGHHGNPLSGENSGRKPADEVPGDYPNPLLRNNSHMDRRGQKVINRNPEINKVCFEPFLINLL